MIYFYSILLLAFNFGSLIYFDLNVVCDIIKRVNFLILHAYVQIFQHCLLKRLSFLHWIILASLLKINGPCMWGFISGICILLNFYMFVLMPVPYCFNYCSFVVNLEVKSYEFQCIILLEDYFWLFKVLCNLFKLEDWLFNFCEKAIEFFCKGCDEGLEYFW